jgi:hypothetical protein
MQPWRYPALLSLVMVGCVVISCAPKDQQFSFDFKVKGHSIFKNTTEEDAALSPEEQRCIRRRFALLHRLGGKYQQVLADVEPLNLSNQFTSAALMCFHPKIATLSELDQFGALIFYHEAIHLLSSSGDLIRTHPPTEQHAGSAWSAFHEPFYRYYVAEASPQHLFLPYLPETLPMHTIYEPLKGQPYLAHLERYFSAANDNNFYSLLEEWNAYNAGLDLAVALFDHGLAPCAPEHTSDIANAAMEFAVYTATYLEALHRQSADLFHILLQDKALREFLRFQQTKTQRLVAAGQSYPCLFNALTPQLQPAAQEASRRLLELIGEL